MSGGSASRSWHSRQIGVVVVMVRGGGGGEENGPWTFMSTVQAMSCDVPPLLALGPASRVPLARQGGRSFVGGGGGGVARARVRVGREAWAAELHEAVVVEVEVGEGEDEGRDQVWAQRGCGRGGRSAATYACEHHIRHRGPYVVAWRLRESGGEDDDEGCAEAMRLLPPHAPMVLRKRVGRKTSTDSERYSGTPHLSKD
jgi:hypothetical protein